MVEKTDLAPIVLFVYNRLEHTKKTVETLQKNYLSSESKLYIYADASKNDTSANNVKEVRAYIRSIQGFKEVIIIERKKNFGLAASIIDGVTSVIKQYGKVIVLEDDLITSKYFLQYMNDALRIYAKNENIFSVTGFSFSTQFMDFPVSYQEDLYLNIRPMSWSWATWKDRWDKVDWEVTKYPKFITDTIQKKKFNKGGTDLTRMLKKQMNGKSDSWYIRWTFHAIMNNKLTVYPKISYVNNIGHDDSGVHCTQDNDNIYSHRELNHIAIGSFPEKIQLEERIVKSFNKAFDTNYVRIFKREFKKLFSR